MLATILSETANLALETVKNDTIVLLNEEPLYAYLMVDARIQLIRRDIEVAAVSMTNGDFVLYINPEGYLSYPQGERLFILKHEWTHWIEEHPLLNDLYIHKFWNLACDISINQTLETGRCIRPKDAQMPEMYQFPPHLSPEVYYDLLVESSQKESEKIPVPKEQKPKQEEPKKKEDEPTILKGYITKLNKLSIGFFLVRLDGKTIVFTHDTSFFDENGAPISFSNLQEEQYAEALVLTQEDGYIGTHLRLTAPQPKEEHARSSSSSINGKAIDEEQLENMHPTWKDASKESPHMMKKSVSDKIKKALTSMEESDYDDLPSKLVERLQTFMKSTTDWKGPLKIFVGSQRGQRKEYTYRKRNRRIPLSPGIKKATRLRLGVIVDTSISISDAVLQQFDAEIRKISQTHRDIKIVVIICDQVIHDVYEYDKKLIRDGIKLSGRGGTDFRPPFQMISKREHPLFRQKIDAVLYLTDGVGIAPTACSIPTLWVLTEDGQLPFVESFHSGEHVTWGRTIRLN